ncbi:formation of crista junctions protein 1 [Coniella lustricola]|uniref:MICOS complex subunit MIC60 n=1 Tax=Coniella lustricola TaxID=2025994 RepID=A0A2T3AFD0_9PEZI|nr:formation of crista junctions protein 1 [Coniella lustricola]
MLRTSLRSVRGLSSRSVAAAAGRQWPAVAARPASLIVRRGYADEKPPVPKIPAIETNTAPSTQPPPPLNESNVAASTIAAENVPLTPPTPEQLGGISPEGPVSATHPPSGTSFIRRLRNYVLTLVILGTVAFGGGVYYARVNDRFHDFFTEYVPYGEQAVLYLEEAEFRKRFPNISNRSTQRPRDTSESVRIPAHHGVAWRVADAESPSGKPSEGADKAAAARKEAAKKASSSAPAPTPAPAAVPATSPEASQAKPKAVAEAQAKKDATATASDFKAPEVNEPSRYPPAAPIKPIYVTDVQEPVVQDLARMLNGIITVINADGAHGKYASAIEKAKNDLQKVSGEINKIKETAEADAASQVKARVGDFDKAANDLVESMARTMSAKEASWRQEFDEELKKINDAYNQRVSLLTEREKGLYQEKLQNQLLEQAIALKRQFMNQIQKQVETERNGRLGKLEELSKSVASLESLADGWNEVIDMNLRTQQLHVAVEAVRASLEDAAHPRPFIKELVALKEIAADDAVVNAAIASINPTAYQRGVSNSAELIDRFRRVANEVRKASLLPEDAGVASHASSFVLSKVLFKKQGLAAGDDVESILTRTQTFLEEGNLDAAAREMNGLSGWAKTLSRDWLGEVRKVLEVRQALEVIQTEARLQSLKVE